MQKITQKDAIVNLDDEYFDDNEQKTATKHASSASGQWYCKCILFAIMFSMSHPNFFVYL